MSSDQERLLYLQKEFHISQLRLKECGLEWQQLKGRVLQELLDLEVCYRRNERKAFDSEIAQLKSQVDAAKTQLKKIPPPVTSQSLARVTVAGDSSSNKDILAVSICEAVPANSDTQSTVVGNVVTHKLQETAEGIDGEDAEPDKEVVDFENCEQSNTATVNEDSTSLCPQRASLSGHSSCNALTSEVQTEAVVEDSTEQENSVEPEKKVMHKKKRKAAKWKNKKVAMKKKQTVPLLAEDPVDTTTNDPLEDATKNQRDKKELGDQREALDSQTEMDHREEQKQLIDQCEELGDHGEVNNLEIQNKKSDDQTEVDKIGNQSKEIANQRGLDNQNKESDQAETEVDKIGNQSKEIANQRGLDNQNKESDQAETEVDKIGNQRESFDQSEEIANQRGLESQSNESDGQVEGLDDQAVDRLANQAELADQSKELADQRVPEDQAKESVCEVEELDDHAEVSQSKGSQSELLAEELWNQRGLPDQRQQPNNHDQTELGQSEALGNQREDTDSQTEGETLHNQEGVAPSDITLAITTIADSSVTHDLQEDNSGMEAIDDTSTDCLPIQTPIDNQTKSPYMQPSHDNEASPKTSDSVLAVRQEIEHSKDSNVTTMSFEGQQQSAEKQSSAQGKTNKRLSKKKKRKPKRVRTPQSVLPVQGKKRGRGRPKKIVVQVIPDSTAAPDDSTVSEHEENNEKSPESLVSSTSRTDVVSSHDMMATVTHCADPSSPNIVTSSDATTTCNIPPGSSSNSTNTPTLDPMVVEATTGGSEPSLCGTDKVVNRLAKKPSYRTLRKRQSTVATVASATKKLKFDDVEIKQESSTSQSCITPSVGLGQQKRKTTIATVKGEVTQQEITVSKVAPEASPLATVNSEESVGVCADATSQLNYKRRKLLGIKSLSGPMMPNVSFKVSSRNPPVTINLNNFIAPKLKASVKRTLK